PHVAGSMRAQDDGRPLGLDTERRLLDRVQGAKKFPVLVFRQLGQNSVRLLIGSKIQRPNRRPAAGGKEKIGGAIVVLCGCAYHKPSFFEFVQNAAEVSRVEAQSL